MKEATLVEQAIAIAKNPIGYLAGHLVAHRPVTSQSMADRIALDAAEALALDDQRPNGTYAQVVLTELNTAGLLDSSEASAAARLAARRLAQAANDPDAGK